MSELKRPSKARLFFHELKNAGGDGSAKSLAIGVAVLSLLCSAGGVVYYYLANNPQILSGLGIR